MSKAKPERKPIAHFTGKGASVTTMYVDEDGKMVVTTRPSKIKRGIRSKVTREQVEEFKKRRSAGFGKASDNAKKRK